MLKESESQVCNKDCLCRCGRCEGEPPEILSICDYCGAQSKDESYFEEIKIGTLICKRCMEYFLEVDANNAPKGYYATLAFDGCTGCEFVECDSEELIPYSCTAKERQDNKSVIFIKKVSV
jgi:hypothetical protein